MKPLRVLLLTVRGPGGQVDVAVRVDVALIDVLPVVREAVGLSAGGATATLERASASHGAHALPLEQALAGIGLLDGDVVILRSDSRDTLDEFAPPWADVFTRPVAGIS